MKGGNAGRVSKVSDIEYNGSLISLLTVKISFFASTRRLEAISANCS